MPGNNMGKLLACLVPVAFLVMLSSARAAPMEAPMQCTLVLDRQTGTVLLRDGTCDKRLSPMSTFKVPLAVIGYDAGILENEHAPTWAYKPEFKAEKRARKPVDPTIWQADSIVWFSQELTRKLGDTRFADYVARLDYGNRDVRGDGKDGLTHAWLMSSLKISPEEQADFMRRLVNRQLPVSSAAMDMTLKVIPAFRSGDWQVHGKTGSGLMRQANGTLRLGWFVGWAEKDGRQIVFARMRLSPKRASEAPGLALRAEFLKDLPDLMKEGR